MIEQLTVKDLGSKADGIAQSTSGSIFIPYTLPGEVVEADITGNRGRILHIVRKAQNRIMPVCPHFGTCGGCNLQHMAFQAYLEWKRLQVENALRQRNINVPIFSVIAIGLGTRRRASFSFRKRAGKLDFGFYKKWSTEILTPASCPILHPLLEKHMMANHFYSLACALIPPNNTESRMTANLGQNGISVDITGNYKNVMSNSDDSHQLCDAIEPFWKVSLNGQDVIEIADDTVQNGPFALNVPPGAFIQASSEAEQILVTHLVSFLNPAKRCLDLFSGIGTFSIHLARYAPVLAVDSDARALRALDQSWHNIGGLKSLKTLRRNLFKHPMTSQELSKFDTVIFDPPRDGAKAQCEELARSSVQRISSISCNPITFARDSEILIKGGYTLLGVQPIDQFLYTHHVELVANFERTN